MMTPPFFGASVAGDGSWGGAAANPKHARPAIQATSAEMIFLSMVLNSPGSPYISIITSGTNGGGRRDRPAFIPPGIQRNPKLSAPARVLIEDILYIDLFQLST